MKRTLKLFFTVLIISSSYTYAQEKNQVIESIISEANDNSH